MRIQPLRGQNNRYHSLPVSLANEDKNEYSCIILTLFTALVACSQVVFAVVYPLLPKDSSLTGENIQITVLEENKLPLESFTAQYHVGLE